MGHANSGVQYNLFMDISQWLAGRYSPHTKEELKINIGRGRHLPVEVTIHLNAEVTTKRHSFMRMYLAHSPCV